MHEWHRLVPLLQAENLWTERDRTALEVYVEAVVTFREAVAYVRVSGVMVPGQKPETMVKNPALQIVRDTANIIRAHGSEFGLTPLTRMQLGLPLQEIEDIDAGSTSGTPTSCRPGSSASAGWTANPSPPVTTRTRRWRWQPRKRPTKQVKPETS